MSPILKIVLEIGPLAVFFLTFRYLSHLGEVEALIWATGVFMAVLGASMATTYALTRTLSPMAIVVLVVVGVMGGLTIALNDETFIMMRPTLVNAMFALALGYGLLRGQSFLKYLMGELLPMKDEGWLKLTRNWMIFFACMAVVNETVRNTQSIDDWVWIKTFVYLPLTFVFTLSQAPLMAKYAIEEDGAGDDAGGSDKSQGKTA